jgi:hypothetical protein
MALLLSLSIRIIAYPNKFKKRDKYTKILGFGKVFFGKPAEAQALTNNSCSRIMRKKKG